MYFYKLKDNKGNKKDQKSICGITLSKNEWVRSEVELRELLDFRHLIDIVEADREPALKSQAPVQEPVQQPEPIIETVEEPVVVEEEVQDEPVEEQEVEYKNMKKAELLELEEVKEGFTEEELKGLTKAEILEYLEG